MSAPKAAEPPGRGPAYLSIGQVLDQLRPEFPEVTISKIRFLETEGLITPSRTPSGYRKFSRDDVTRLSYILGAQRDRYLPLRVIKQHLDAIDRGLEPPDEPGGAPKVPAAPVDGAPDTEFFAPEPASVRVTRSELLEATGLTDEQLAALEQYDLVAPRAGRYDRAALLVAQAVGKMAEYGIEPRHLRSFRTAADREVGLFEQVLATMLRQRGPEARARARDSAQELAALSVQLHAALVKARLSNIVGH